MKVDLVIVLLCFLCLLLLLFIDIGFVLYVFRFVFLVWCCLWCFSIYVYWLCKICGVWGNSLWRVGGSRLDFDGWEWESCLWWFGLLFLFFWLEFFFWEVKCNVDRNFRVVEVLKEFWWWFSDLKVWGYDEYGEMFVEVEWSGGGGVRVSDWGLVMF